LHRCGGAAGPALPELPGDRQSHLSCKVGTGRDDYGPAGDPGRTQHHMGGRHLRLPGPNHDPGRPAGTPARPDCRPGPGDNEVSAIEPNPSGATQAVPSRLTPAHFRQRPADGAALDRPAGKGEGTVAGRPITSLATTPASTPVAAHSSAHASMSKTASSPPAPAHRAR